MRNPDRETTFRFKHFDVVNESSAMKVGTDGVLLGAWALIGPDMQPARILDTGTGSGVIALMLAQRFTQAEITGIDIDAEACDEAAGNFANSPWSERLAACNRDFLNYQPAGIAYDAIVSNPPFFSDGLRAPDGSRSQARHDDHLSLDSLMRQASLLLAIGGTLSLVLPADRIQDVRVGASLYRFGISRLTWVKTVPRKSPRRILVELSHGRPEISAVERTLSIQLADGSFSPEYVNLLKDFYLKF